MPAEAADSPPAEPRDEPAAPTAAAPAEAAAEPPRGSEEDTLSDEPTQPEQPSRSRRFAHRVLAGPDPDRPRRSPNVGAVARKSTGMIGGLVATAGVLAAVIVAVGILFVAFDANAANAIVSGFHSAADFLVGPFHGLFHLDKPKHQTVLNWAIAAIVYLVAGFIIRKILSGKSG
jgi:hypothetical protein